MLQSTRLAATLAAVLLAAAAFGQSGADSTAVEIERYRDMLADGNPAELYEMSGAALWKTARGPNKVTLEQCDLGLGPGVVKGAYAQLPRYFPDTNKVEDLESRLVTCMVKLQGLDRSQVVKRPFGNLDDKSDIEALVAYVVGQSKGTKINVPLGHAKEKEAFELGKRIFFYRAGPYDFACATCHSTNGQRIRLQELPNLTIPAGAQRAYAFWPAYRVSQGEMRTFQWRLNDCFRQQRFPEPGYISDASIALTSYLAYMANGAVYQGPGLKR